MGTTPRNGALVGSYAKTVCGVCTLVAVAGGCTEVMRQSSGSSQARIRQNPGASFPEIGVSGETATEAEWLFFDGWHLTRSLVCTGHAEHEVGVAINRTTGEGFLLLSQHLEGGCATSDVFRFQAPCLVNVRSIEFEAETHLAASFPAGQEEASCLPGNHLLLSLRMPGTPRKAVSEPASRVREWAHEMSRYLVRLIESDQAPEWRDVRYTDGDRETIRSRLRDALKQISACPGALSSPVKELGPRRTNTKLVDGCRMGTQPVRPTTQPSGGER
jgi:hypothetical protein